MWKKVNEIALAIIVIAAVTWACTALGCKADGSKEAPQSTTVVAPEAIPTAVPVEPTAAPAASRCEDALAVADGIAEGLTVAGGGSLRNAQAVKSGDFESVYFIAAEIDGPGLEGNGEIGLWASNSLKLGGGLIFAIDSVAQEFSDWGYGDETDAQIRESDDGADEAKQCVEDATG